ncbi:MAG: hypothetical protein Q8P40_12360 [Nitrospirota bacterium]|nr:hypothetical protein [Nitrospirota bacterium]
MGKLLFLYIKPFIMKCLLITIILFINFFLSNFTNAAEPNWITTDKGCKVWNPFPKPNESVTWSGECVDGKAHGYGVLQWYENRIKTLRQEFTPTNGVRMEDGVAVATVESSTITFQIIECRKERKDKQGIQWYNSFRVVRGDVSKDVDLGHPIVVKKILSMAEQFVWGECPAKAPFSDDVKLSNVNVKLYQNNQLAVRARSYPEMIGGITYDDKTEWRELDNYVLKKRLAEAKAAQRAEEQRAIEAKKKAEEEKRRLELVTKKAREEKEKMEARKRFDEFVKKNGVKEWPSVDSLSANPFVYEGKTVAIVVEFAEMLTPTQGLFLKGSQPFVVSNIPKGLFTSEKKVVLAGRGLGKTEVKLPLFGEVSVPHLKFVGVHFCKDWGCNEITVK